MAPRCTLPQTNDVTCPLAHCIYHYQSGYVSSTPDLHAQCGCVVDMAIAHVGDDAINGNKDTVDKQRNMVGV